MNLFLLRLYVILICLVLLGGCGEYEEALRLEKVAEYRDRFVNGCMPRKGDIVTAQWVKGELICKRITPTGRYGRTFPHAEVRIAEIEQ